MALKKIPTKKVAPAKKAAPTKAVVEKSAPAAAGTTGTYNGYCVKCKTKDTPYQGVVVVSKTGMNMAQGPCPTCGTKMSRILGKAK